MAPLISTKQFQPEPETDRSCTYQENLEDGLVCAHEIFEIIIQIAHLGKSACHHHHQFNSKRTHRHTNKTKQNGISAGSGMTCHVMIRTTPESRRVNQNLQPRRERVLLVGFYFGITSDMTCMAEGKEKVNKGSQGEGARGDLGFRGVATGDRLRKRRWFFFVKRFLCGRIRRSAVEVADGFVAISYHSSGL